MPSIRAGRGSSRLAALALVLALPACTIARVYEGTPLPENPSEKLVVGATTKTDILKLLGPPSRIFHQTDGDIFQYTFDRTNFKRFAIAEPLITRITLFSWSREDGRRDRLILLFDRAGVLSSYGVGRETADL